MMTDAAYPGEDPRRLLSDTRELARRARQAQRATWFPLLVLAAVTFASIPVYRYGGYHVGACVAVPAAGPQGRVCTAYNTAAFVYWPTALVLAYVAIAAFYIRRSRTRGIETRVRPYAVAGILIAIALTSVSLWQARHPSPRVPAGLIGLDYRLASPAWAIGLGLLVLAWTERNRALVLLTLVYLAVVQVASGTSRLHGPGSLGIFLPLVIDGSVLLLGGIGFAVAQRPLRAPSA
jgi:hypothetical protein